MAYTRLQFRDLIRQRLGWASADTFVTDTELNNYINDSLAELHSLLVTCFRPGQWGMATETITTSVGTPAYTLATTTFGRLFNVRMLYNSRFVPLRAFDISTEDLRAENLSWTPTTVRYALQLASTGAVGIVFDSSPAAVYTLIVYYVAGPPVFASDSDTSWMGFDEYVVLDCMIKSREKEEADVGSLLAEKTAVQQRIRTQAEPLDVGQAATVQDMRALDEGAFSPESAFFYR